MAGKRLAGFSALLVGIASCTQAQERETSARAEDWRPVSSVSPDSSYRHFVDFASIRGAPPTLSYLRRKAQSSRTVAGHGNTTRVVEANCLHETTRDKNDFDAEFTGDPRPAADYGFAYIDELRNVCEWAKTQARFESQNAPSVPAPERGKAPRLSSGSGFLVGAKLVVTNNHVIERCSQVSVRQGDEAVEAVIKATTTLNDLAILLLERPLGTSSPVRSSAILGEDVMAAGLPLAGLLSNDIVVTGGQVNSLAGILNDPSLLQFSAPIQPGNSGGPLIDRSGSVVGVVVSKVNVLKLEKFTGDMAQNVNFAIKPEVLRLFLDTNRVAYQSAGLGKKLENFELADRARRITVQVMCAR